jgi:sugar phosphate isomerase/epimerase
MKYVILISFFCVSTILLRAPKKPVAPEIGVVQDIENDSLLKAFGYRYLVESTSKMLSPRNVSEEKFEQNLQNVKKLRTPLFACNLFIHGDLKVVGPNVDEKAVLSYVQVVFQRAEAAGLKMIIWGSGGSRGVPVGFDRTKAVAQFIYMARKIAVIAAKHNIVIALENLNSTECNFITTVKEAVEVVKSVDHKNLRLCIDIYHMLKESESPNVIASAKKYLVYCEIAEKEGRTPPGVHGDDFRPYFVELRKIGYSGKIMLECRWGNLEEQGVTAYTVLRKQIDEVWGMGE